jgi:hypothetical protein
VCMVLMESFKDMCRVLYFLFKRASLPASIELSESRHLQPSKVSHSLVNLTVSRRP